MSELMDKLLKVSTAPTLSRNPPAESRRVAEFSQSTGAIEVPEDAPEGDAETFLRDAGQDPADWEVTGFKRSEWGDPENPFVSTRFTFKRRPEAARERVGIEDLLALVAEREGQPIPSLPAPAHPGAGILIGDMQFGQGVDDPLEPIGNTLRAIDNAAAELEAQGGAEELLVGWLGDHVEGFTSQGGKNAWRTKLTLSEQIRATRRVMYYAVERFAPLAERLVMAAVPGNHGRVETAAGVSTRADDNHDVEALNAVAEGLALSERYAGVEFYVPEQDEISLAVKVGGITWGLVHGEKWRPGKQWEWWEQQTFHGAPVAAADVLCCGHWHTLWVQEQGVKTFLQVPTLGTDGAWWYHQHGSRPHPGVLLALSDGKEVSGVIPIRA